VNARAAIGRSGRDLGAQRLRLNFRYAREIEIVGFDPFSPPKMKHDAALSVALEEKRRRHEA
jgi:hypothetical protein